MAGPKNEQMDRPFRIALSLSLGCHALFLSVQLIYLRRYAFEKGRKALNVIYDAREVEAVEKELRGLQRQLGQMASLTEGHGALPGIATPTPQIRIPNRTMGGLPLAIRPDASLSRPAVVDLTNLVEAAQGDPVLLSYFSAIREQIQQTANRQTWQSGEATQGLVYVLFVLAATGQVYSAAVLSDRSTPSRVLQEIALKIIKASGPFPAFPPSLSEPSRTVIVPLEFLLGPGPVDSQ